MKSPSISNLIHTHWRGGYSLLVTVVFALLGLRILVGVLQDLMPQPMNDLVLVTWLAFSVLLLIWQIVGGWRASDLHLSSGGSVVTGCAGYLAIPITIILATLQMIDSVTAGIQTQPTQSLVIAELSVQNDGASVAISGSLDWDTHTALTTTLKNHPSISKVILNSKGGGVFPARGLALIIAQFKLNTHINDQCLSACTIVFLAGANRTMSPDAQLGFHQYDMAIPHHIHTIDMQEERGKDQRYFVSRGVSEQFVERVFQADKNNMWIPEQSLLHQQGVLTQ